MRKYSVTTAGYEGSVVLTEQELKEYVKEETDKARRFFGTAVCHRDCYEKVNAYRITARRDRRSAGWVTITARDLAK